MDYKFQILKAATVEPPRVFARQRSGSADHLTHVVEEFASIRKKRWFESDSIASINLESSVKIFHEDERTTTKTSSRMRIFGSKDNFLSRRASVMKLTFTQRRNTVG